MSELELPSIEEAAEAVRRDLAKEQISLHETMERLKAYQRDARSQEQSDRIERQMREAWSDHQRAIEPLRRYLDAIIRAQAGILAVRPMGPFIITGDGGSAI